MQRRPLLINTAPGGIVNEAALVEALKSGQISEAGFDVMTQEPPCPEHPFHELMGFPNFIVAPHVAWASEQALRTLVDTIGDNIEAFAMGAPRSLVTP